MESIQSINYYTGTSGLLLPVPNKLFYPEEFKTKSRLQFYASLMNSIEINSSFYKIPMASTLARWSGDVPHGFRFTFKLFREVTHNKGLAFDPETVKKFITIIDAVGKKKGALLVQFPPSVSMEQWKQLSALINCLRDNDPDHAWSIALEFRHPSLYNSVVYDLLEAKGMGIVIHDKAPAMTPIRDNHLPFIYMRFHGPEGNYRGSYDEMVLAEYASYIREWLMEEKTVYTYFNNTMGNAIGNLDLLRDRVVLQTGN